jgi:hypothetical protein
LIESEIQKNEIQKVKVKFTQKKNPAQWDVSRVLFYERKHLSMA